MIQRLGILVKARIHRAARRFRAGLGALTALATVGFGAGADALELKVFSGAGGFGVNSTMVIGREEVIVVDAQYVRSDAHRLVAELLETRRRVSTVYITHAHPDHFLGSEVLAQAFPEARFVATPEVLAEIETMIPQVLGRPGFKDDPNNLQSPVTPSPLTADSLSLDGETITILSGLTGDDEGPETAVFIPSLKALITGDVAFDGVHLWTAHSTPTSRLAWVESVKRLEQMQPDIVIAGHRAPNGASGTGVNGVGALAFTRSYLEAFDAALASAAGADELIRRVTDRYPWLAYPEMLQIGAEAAFSQGRQ